MGRKPKNTDGFRIHDVRFIDPENEAITRLDQTELSDDIKNQFLNLLKVFTGPNYCYSLMDRGNAARRIISLIDIAEMKDPTY